MERKICFRNYIHLLLRRGRAKQRSKQPQLVTSEILTSPSLHALLLPALPFDLIEDILCRLPVKLLLQLRCLSKFFNSLISDPKFIKKHLQLSIKRPHLLIVNSKNHFHKLLLFDSPMSFVLSTSTVTQTQLSYPVTHQFGRYNISSCDGIFCFPIGKYSAVLWNPCIRKFKLLPRLTSRSEIYPFSTFSFGYDHFIDNYKIIAISFCINNQIDVRINVSVNIMGTDCWTNILGFPYCRSICGSRGVGVFVSGTVNWLTNGAIVSLDLKNETFQKLSIPDLKNDNCTLRVVRDCLYIFECNDMFLDVWIMKEYGNKESWTKLYNVPYKKDQILCSYRKTFYISEDDQLLMNFYDLKSKNLKLVIYDSKNSTWKVPEIQNTKCMINSEVYIESLILPGC